MPSLNGTIDRAVSVTPVRWRIFCAAKTGWLNAWKTLFCAASNRNDYSDEICTFGIISVSIFVFFILIRLIWNVIFYAVKVKEQFEISLVEETVDTVRGGGSSNSNSPPNSNSSPESPYSSSGGSCGGGGTMERSPAVRQELAAIWRCYIHLMDEINNVTQTLGKDGKFQLFICLSLR